jgi:uncharacterized protein
MEPYNQELIAYRISRSKETTKEAKLALDNDFLFNAGNRIYYAIFYIVSALAILKGFSTSKHSQLLGWFIKNFVKEEIVSKEFGEIYQQAFKFRQKSDYEDLIQLNREDVERHYNNMLLFVNEIEKLINN